MRDATNEPAEERVAKAVRAEARVALAAVAADHQYDILAQRLQKMHASTSA